MASQPLSSAQRPRRRAEGVVVRHQRRCNTRQDGACSCTPSYQAQAWSARDNKPIRRTFTTLADAKAWRQDSQAALRKGTLRAPVRITLNEAATDWLDAARRGVVRTRSGDTYKPSALRTYHHALRKHLLPMLGQRRLSAITRLDIQHLVDELTITGAAPSTVRNAVLPLRAIYRRAHSHEIVAVNPTLGLTLPAVRGQRDRVTPPNEAAALLTALPPQDQGIWATAMYAGLRRGELQALRWADLNLDTNIITVTRSWDRIEGPVPPKSRAGNRRIPLIPTLRRYLIHHRLRQANHHPQRLIFGAHANTAFEPVALNRRADHAWNAAQLRNVRLHECRHTYAAFMIAAGINPKALCTYMGHSSITVTLDRYGHLMPGAEHEAATMLEHYLTTEPNHHR